MKMLKELKRLPYLIILLIFVVLIFFKVIPTNRIKNTTSSDLVVFGDNIKTDYKPFIENGGIYISTDTISKLIDSDIYYDKVATKLIITTSDRLIKFKIDENKMTENFVDKQITTPAKIVNDMSYLDINLVKDVYGVKVEYNEKTNTITIDKKDTSGIAVKYNRVNVYEDLSTKSNVIEHLNNTNTVTVYDESLNHNRWYKIKTDTGVVGYISKNNVDLNNTNKENKNETDNTTQTSNEKITMFWQYGSDLNTLGSKIEGVDVVSPTWYELSNKNGEISSKYSSAYFNQAKQNGYKLWPIVTNGIDDVNYTPDVTSAMLNSEQNREAFIKNLLRIAKEDKIDGINIDFEQLYDNDRDVFTQFIKELTSIFRSENITVSVDTYFVRYLDRQNIGRFCDYMILMGYDHRGSWSSEAGSIADIPWVEENIVSMLNDSNIPASKIILGVPFYTRIWRTNTSTNNLTSSVYSMEDCVDFINRNDLAKVWDADAGQNYVETQVGNTKYQLWIEDADSMKQRIEIVKKYNLAGISAWRKGLETNDIWNVILENMK